MSIFDSISMDIVEEVQLFQQPVDFMIESVENPKLKSCIITSSKKSNIIRLVSFRENTESIIDIGMIKLSSTVQSICELKDMNMAVALKNSNVEIWNLNKSNSPSRILKVFDNILTKIISLEQG